MVKKDPLEGFQIVGYDEDTKTLKIAIAGMILRNQGQQEVIFERGKEIIEFDGGKAINQIVFVTRESEK